MFHEKSRILAQLQAYRAPKPGPFWAAAGIAGISLFGVVAAFGTALPSGDIDSLRKPVIQQLDFSAIDVLDTGGDIFVREERIQRGDTVADLLNRLGIEDATVFTYLKASSAASPLFRQLSPGKNVTAYVSGQGELVSLVFPLNGSKDQALVVERMPGSGFSVGQRTLEFETQVLMKSAEIRHSLFGASDAAGVPDSIATQLADIFGGDIDFHRDLRKGDRFSVVYESVSHLGRTARTGRVLAAEFINGGKVFRAIWFGAEQGSGGYYTPEGKNIRKAFLRSPLEFSRITSGFSLSRLHPVLQTVRAHKGIDYGAPIGTRVRATGDGSVEFIGNQGGYGKLVMLRHQSQYVTVYGHLSGFAPSLRKGTRVAQGDVIGFVGATGLATGPHLHYEFRINGVHQNPLAIALPTAPPLAADQLPQFREQSHALLSRLDQLGTSNLARLD